MHIIHFISLEYFNKKKKTIYIYVNVLDNKQTKVESTDDKYTSSLLNNRFAEVQGNVITLTTQINIVKIKCKMRSEIELHYIKVSDIVTYTYSGINKGDFYECLVMNNRAMVTLIEISEYLELTATNNNVSDVASGLADEVNKNTLTIKWS